MVLLAAALWLTDETTFPLLCCCVFLQAIFGIELMRSSRFVAHAAPVNYLPYYFLAFGCLWVAAGRQHHWYVYFAQGVMVLIPLLLVARDDMRAVGASPGGNPSHLAGALASRLDLPDGPAGCRTWPELKAFREALGPDASAAFELLKHPRRQVRYAALAALESHHNWAQTEVELVLRMARQDPDEELRCAAILALANVDDRQVVEELASFMENASCAVRETVVQSTFRNLEERWSWVRQAVKGALAKPTATHEDDLDGIMQLPLPGAAVDDLIAWAGEKGHLAQRASRILAGYYGLRLDTSDENGELAVKIQRAVVSYTLPASLRIELTRILHARQMLRVDTARYLTNAACPTPVRLLAVEVLLEEGSPEEARGILVELGRISNRELSLTTARLVQNHLGVDLGLPLSGPPPAWNTRHAQQTVERLMRWSRDQAPDRQSPA